MADTKTYLKVPYRDSVLRVLPLNEGHVIGLKMAGNLPGATQVGVLFRILRRVLDEADYIRMSHDLIDGETELTDLSAFLNAVVVAEQSYAAATQGQGLDA